MKYPLLSILTLVSAIPLSAQHAVPAHPDREVKTNAVFRQYEEALSALSKRYGQWEYNRPDTLSNPYYFALFSGSTFFDQAIHNTLGTLDFRSESPAPDDSLFHAAGNAAEDTLSISRKKRLLEKHIDRSLLTAYTFTPWHIRYYESPDIVADGIRKDVIADVKPDVKLADKFKGKKPLDEAEPLDDDWNIVVRRPNFWKFSSTFSTQFMQNYVSDNWYKGGESSNSLLANTVIKANYDNKRKVTFENTLEMKLGFLASLDDDAHKYRTNSDQLRLTNKLSLKAIGRWNYTLMLQSWTQFCKGYKANDEYVYSDFMSPFESVFSVGMTYKLNNVKNFSLDATVSPFAGNFKYVDRLYLATSFGLKENHHTKFEFGSNITITYNWTIWKNIKWDGRIYYFTDYSKTQFEWENTLTFKVNNFLSSKLFFYPRFDDSVARVDDDSYFQLKEWLSVGLDLSF